MCLQELKGKLGVLERDHQNAVLKAHGQLELVEAGEHEQLGMQRQITVMAEELKELEATFTAQVEANATKDYTIEDLESKLQEGQALVARLGSEHESMSRDLNEKAQQLVMFTDLGRRALAEAEGLQQQLDKAPFAARELAAAKEGAPPLLHLT